MHLVAVDIRDPALDRSHKHGSGTRHSSSLEVPKGAEQHSEDNEEGRERVEGREEG